MLKKSFTLIALSLALVLSAKANSISVAEVGIGANETVHIKSSTLGSDVHVYAGVVKLKIDGELTDAFCIDPWHWSSNAVNPYEIEDLSLAPKSANATTPNPMGVITATKIEQLWAQYYTASINKVTAAALQLSIWCLVDEAVANGSYKLLSIDADSALVKSKMTEMNNFLVNNPTAKRAHLVAITGRPQDYVIETVPDSLSSVLLLSLSLCGVALLRRRSSRN